MEHLVGGLFNNSKKAGNAVSKLFKLGYIEDISVLSKKHGKLESIQVKKNITGLIITGFIIGGVIGGITGILSTMEVTFIPRVGTDINIGITSMIAGALGFIIGSITASLLVAVSEVGNPQEKANMYKEKIERGQVYVAISTGHRSEGRVKEIFEQSGSNRINIRHRLVRMI